MVTELKLIYDALKDKLTEEGVVDWHEYVECVRNDSFEK